jgi:hypothetical protein
LFALTTAVTAIALIKLTLDLLFQHDSRRSTARVWEQLSYAQRACGPSSAMRPAARTHSGRCRHYCGPS